MKHKNTLTVLAVLASILAIFATIIGIFTKGGPGTYSYESIRGQMVPIYGKGIYQHMSADVAIQGIAQDFVTLFVAMPLLLFALVYARKGSLRARFVLAGTFFYFLVTFLFYTTMGMYNSLFLVYVALLGLSFFGLSITLLSFDVQQLPEVFVSEAPARFVGGFLIFNVIAIALLWLGVIVPPLLDGTIYPAVVQHYTTLIVQGLDLGLLLPIGFVAGWLLLRKRPLGYLMGTTYIIFLAILMTALTAKLIAMGLAGVNIIPAVFIIPAFNLIAIAGAFAILRKIKN